LIKTFTNPGELILDNCAGSGTTGLAAKSTGRNYILIEKELEVFNLCKGRLKE
jgi:DNA modification methylase